MELQLFSGMTDLETQTPNELIEIAKEMINGRFDNIPIAVDLINVSMEQSLAAHEIGDVVARGEYLRAWLDISTIVKEFR